MAKRLAVVFALGLVACGSSDRPAPLADSGAPRRDSGSRSRDAGADGTLDAGTSPRDGSSADASDTAVHACKRGIATDNAPSASLAGSASAPRITWWYDWSTTHDGGSAAIEFVPMVWGSADLGRTLPAGAKYVLGFNEPNFKAQSDLTAAQAAAEWPMLQQHAKAVGARVVSPAVNFCGSATDPSQCSDPSVTDPYTYVSDFLADCDGCEVDYIAVHWYNCDLPSLQGYLDGNTLNGGDLPGFVQFDKPIWLTEFACDATHSVADQKAYMEVAVPYLEANPHVFRYSWFSASNIPNALLANPDGSPTELGTTYAGLAESCP